MCLSHLVTALSCSEIVRGGGDGARGEQTGQNSRREEREGQKRKEKTKKDITRAFEHDTPAPKTLQRRRLTGLYVYDFSAHV